MSLKLRFTPQGDPLGLMLDEIIAAEKAVTRGTRAAGRGLLRDWRAQVRAALSYRIAGALRARNYPARLDSINAAALVYAPSGGAQRYRGDQSATAAEVLDAHDRGGVIRSERGLFLAIPLGKAARMRGADATGRGNRMRITPGGWERRTGRRLRFVYRSLLVDDGTVAPGNVMLWRNGRRNGGYRSPRAVKKYRKEAVPIFVLVPQVRLRRKLDLDRASDAWGEKLPGLILDSWRDV